MVMVVYKIEPRTLLLTNHEPRKKRVSTVVRQESKANDRGSILYTITKFM